MSRIKDWIVRQQEIDSMDDPDMQDCDRAEASTEASAATPKSPSEGLGR